MLNILNERWRQGRRTMQYPAAPPPTMPDRFRGLPVIDVSKCPESCRDCARACPTGAISFVDNRPQMDLGKCIFCTDCMDACPEKSIDYTQDYRLSVRKRDDLVVDGQALQLAEALDEKSRKLFGRSLHLRQVSAGGCNACEADINVLSTIVWDLGRFGVKVVASPRHADGLIITGPVTSNMRAALQTAYECTPAPKIVIAVGACAISGGPFIDHPEVHNGANSVVLVDLYIPGCPPHPLTILDGILRLLGRLEKEWPVRTNSE